MSKIPSSVPKLVKILSLALWLIAISPYSIVSSSLTTAELEEEVLCDVLSNQAKCTWTECIPIVWGDAHGCGAGSIYCENPSKCSNGWQYKCCKLSREFTVPLGSRRSSGKRSNLPPKLHTMLLHQSSSQRGKLNKPADRQQSEHDEENHSHQEKDNTQIPTWWWSAMFNDGKISGLRNDEDNFEK